ncbi:MAG: S8 family serine peptidase [Bacteroidales bacterium]|nr:S8 family serine peptidase [Bacteroidales bacterium]
MIRKIVSALFAAAVLFSACSRSSESLLTGAQEEAKTAYATKVVNNPEEADENSLIIVLEESVAQTLAQGGTDEALAALCEEVGAVSFERIFVSDNELARSKGLHRWYLASFDAPKNPQAMAQKFVELKSVSYVQFNTKVYRNFVSEGTSYHYTPKGFGDFNVPFNDPLLSDQWHYINNCDLSVAETSRPGADINVKDAWRLCAGDPDIIVAICDEGVKYNHPDLIDNMWVNEDEIPGNGIDDDNNGYVDDIHGWNFLSTTDYPKEISWSEDGDKGHGTHVAGTVAAVNNNGLGVGGVAGGSGNGDGIKMMSCQVFSGNSSATIAARAKAYEYAANNGACIIQCSFGLPGGNVTSDYVFELTYNVEKAGLDYFINYRQAYSPVNRNFAIFATGNDGYHLAGYPAAHREVIGVSAFGPDYLPAVYTNYGPGTNISAPGGDITINMTAESDRATILSTVPSDCSAYDTDYGYMQGTSMACPHVSGVVALGLAYAKKLGKEYTYDEFLSMIYSSVNNIDYYIETSKKKSNGIDFDLTKYWQAMGTGAIDTWRLFMQIEGTPTLVAKTGELSKLALGEYFGGAAANLTYLSVELSDEAREALGVVGTPEVKNGKLNIECTKVGSAKVVVKAIAGGDVLGNKNDMGGSAFTKEISVLSREVAVAKNGGWL